VKYRPCFTALFILLFLLSISGCGWLKTSPKPLPRTAVDVTVGGAAAGGMSQAEVAALLLPMAQSQYVAPRDAAFDPDSGLITAEEPGIMLDISATVQQVLDAPPQAAVTPVFRTAAPSVTAASLEKAQRLGACTTKIIDRTPARVHNIRLAARVINNALIEPGYEFSFNRRLGEPTADRGFLPATIFAEGGRLEQDVGGGVCQVSSTIYNAALAAGLTITERHPHSQPVAYVPPGRDATTYTDKDLRFVNSTRRRIIVRSLLTSSGLSADIWGLSP